MDNSLKDKVLEAIDIVDVVGERVRLVRKGKEYLGLCPFHNDHKPSMTVSSAKQIFKCFSCGAGGDVIKFVQMRDRVDFRAALHHLAERAGVAVDDQGRRRVDATDRDALRRVMGWAGGVFHRNLTESPAGKEALAYAKSRGISEQSIAAFKLGFAENSWDALIRQGQRSGVSNELLEQTGLVSRNDEGRMYDRFRNRLIFPILDGQSRPVAFGGRTLGDDPAKYLNSPDTPLFNKSRILFGLHTARDAMVTARSAIIVEGYLDALLLQQEGVATAVATLGTALTDSHLKLLKPLADELYMCFDPDQAGMKAADRAVETALKHGLEVRVVICPPGEDPADVVIGRGASAFKELLPIALPALEFKWNTTLKAFQAGRHSRRDAFDAFIRFVAQAADSGGIDPLEQGLLISRLSDILGVSAAAIYETLQGVRNRGARGRQTESVEVAETTTYEESIRRLSPGLVAVGEELFGHVLRTEKAFAHVRDRLAEICGAAPAWQKLMDLMEATAQQGQAVTQPGVLAICDEPEVCELISRAIERVGKQTADVEAQLTLLRRLEHELEMDAMARLRGQCRKTDESGGRALDAIMAIGRAQPFPVTARHRWGQLAGQE